MKAKREVESFPGRRGRGKTLIMYPLPFSKFVELFGMKIPKGDVDYAMSKALDYIQYRQKLTELLDVYLLIGGFPNAIRDYFTTGKVNKSTISDFISSLILDVNKLKRSESLFKLTIKAIIERTTSEFSYHTIAKQGIGSVKSAISYVSILEKLFLLKTILAIDPNTGSPIPRKEKKFYFVDPFIYRAFAEWAFANLPNENELIEAVVVSHLSRIFPLFYLKRNGEVDIVIRQGEKFRGFEVKYGKAVRRKYIGKIKNITFLSKEEIGENVIPIPLFLALLDIPQSVEMMEIV
ncbi:DUF4143 domain-containing protein [Sulfolobus tengchongensis]|uniref:DUF4143 domain-containing protein n=1 Tax=Sulfolobus tengchongensis TaxID=207809 RepID=A0AAX4KYP7_9CREN